MEALKQNWEESSQTAKKVASLAASSEAEKLEDLSKQRLAVGASISSTTIDYKYFEVGTGQVSYKTEDHHS